MIPGEILFGEGPLSAVPDAPLTRLVVTNTGDRPIQVGSHFHLAEANPALAFDREVAHGQRLAIPAGTAVRFEPGISREVEVVTFGGARVAAGFRGQVAGPLDREGASGA